VKGPLRIKGIAASPGIAIGPARVVVRERLRIPKKRIEADEVEGERSRLTSAVVRSREQLESAKRVVTEAGGGRGDHALIIQAHLLMLEDELLIDGASELIEEQGIGAEWALQQKTEELRRSLDALDDEYLRERVQDVNFVSDRIMRNLLGASTNIIDNGQQPTECILISTTLSPAETAQMLGCATLGFAIEEGTSTSHTAIMAQALGIPAVVAVEGLADYVGATDIVIVDGLDGVVIIRPDEALISRYRERAARYAEREKRLRTTRDQPAETTDGLRVELLSNIELPGEAPLALEYGAEGIGLYRTEFLFLDRADPPDEDEQHQTYLTVVDTVAPRPVVFRTFDLGADKVPGVSDSPERNPALGLRAIRLGLQNRPLFKTQLRALLRAAQDASGDLRIMFPMISGVSELRQVRAVLEEAQRELGMAVPETLKIGCMIELPSAVFAADLLAREVDFFSIGTNDLIQYSLAIDRGNDDVAYLYSPFHPSVLRAIRLVIEAGDRAGVSVSLCGGAAADPAMVPLLIGLGLKSFSMAPASVPFVKAAVRSISGAEATELASRALKLATAGSIEELARSYIRDKLDDQDG
jgi:phosphotransferase system enzyme I (PtsI)